MASPRIDGFKVSHRIGTGGYSEVFLATDPTGREVALKVLAPRFRRNPSVCKRLAAEGRIGKRVGRHAHVVETLSQGTGPDGPYLVLEYLDGPSLRQRIGFGPLPDGDLLSLAREMARALIHINVQGVLHNDVKPENIFVTDGGANLIDFGASERIGAMRGFFSRKRRPDGSPSYISPERLAGHKVDPRSDMYSLGVTLYEAATARKPFQGGSMRDLLVRHLSGVPPTPVRKLAPQVSRTVAGVIERCCRMKPDERYNNLHEFLLALRKHPMYDSSARFQVDFSGS